MRDQFDREIDYIRISVTDRCNLRCVYCMPEEGVDMLSHNDILTYEELEKLIRALVRIGITKIKLTGGEPLVRRGLVSFIARIKAIRGVEEVTLTTNGLLLESMAEDLIRSGIDRINISIDTLDPKRYAQTTRGGDIHKVLRGMDRLLDLSFSNLKINSVPLRNQSEQDVLELAQMAADRDITIRFIEMMPMGQGKAFNGLTQVEIKDLIRAHGRELIPYEKKMGNGPATYYSLTGYRGKIGFIQAINEKFCHRCNRIRITPTGHLKLCLHYNKGVDLREDIRTLDEVALADKLEQVIRQKPKEHLFSDGHVDEEIDQHNMNQIGG